MLDEEEPAAGPEHAAELPERPRLVVHAAEDERRDGGVERVVLERQVLGRRPQHGRVGRLVPCAFFSSRFSIGASGSVSVSASTPVP